MWIFSQHGFYSVVADRDQPDRHLVRARIQGDLENLKRLAGISAEIVATPDADYACRIYVTAPEYQRIMTALANTVDYPNFKSQVGKRPDQAGRTEVYHRIWAEAAQMQSKRRA